VALWKRKIRGGFGRLLGHSISLQLGVGDRELFWRNLWCNTKKEGIIENVFLLVCYFNGKWLKHFYVFCVSLFYYDM
jgi:hypothetical protein